MSVEGIRAFLESPYGVIADVKMLNLFRLMGVTTAVVLGFLAVASVFVQNFWCRYLCPYGALTGLLALLSPLRIRRDADALHRLRASARRRARPGCRWIRW